MPILAKSTGRNLPGRGLINPAFTIKIVPATDSLQQQPSSGRDNPNNDYLDNLKVGAEIVADLGKRKIKGTVQRIEKNELGDGVYVIIKDPRGKQHKVEGSRISRVGKPNFDDDKARLQSSPALFNESKFLSYENFLNESYSTYSFSKISQLAKTFLESPNTIPTSEMLNDFLKKFNVEDNESDRFLNDSKISALYLAEGKTFQGSFSERLVNLSTKRGISTSRAVSFMRKLASEDTKETFDHDDVYYWVDPSTDAASYANKWGCDLIVIMEQHQDAINDTFSVDSFFFIFIENENLIDKNKGFLTGKRYHIG